jgi:hypothetical protein
MARSIYRFETCLLVQIPIFGILATAVNPPKPTPNTRIKIKVNIPCH